MLKIATQICLLFIYSGLFLSSCDAIVRMPYLVKNKTNKSIRIKISDYGSNPCSIGSFIDGGTIRKDTIIELKPRQSITVGCETKIDFPWGQKNIYRARKGVGGFDLIQNDTVVKIDKSDKYWKYRHKSSVFPIRRSMLK